MGEMDYAERQAILEDAPWPGPDPIDRIRHTVAMHQMHHKAGDYVVLDATYGVYPADVTLDGEEFGVTGFTFDDLIAVVSMLDGDG